MDAPNLSPIKGFNSFKKVYENSERSHFGNVLIFVSKNPIGIKIKGKDLNPEIIYFGLTVPKKLYKKAVVRNRIKRLIREALRQSVRVLSQQYNLSKLNAILISYKSEKISSPKEIAFSVVYNHLFPALEKYCKRNCPKVNKIILNQSLLQKTDLKPINPIKNLDSLN